MSCFLSITLTLLLCYNISADVIRLVYDRETGKPKGYGFCEYQDQETALSAMRNLNGREFSGRALRVDNAASEKNKEELKSTTHYLFFLIQLYHFMYIYWFPALNYVLIWCVNVTGLGTGAPTIESPYGDSVQPQEAPESISRAVASLPPEQMFELMKQMKVRTFATWLLVNLSYFTKKLCPQWTLKDCFRCTKKACLYWSIS